MSFNNIIAKEAWLPTTIMWLMATGSNAVGSFLILYAREQGVTSNIGWFFSVTAITMLVTRPMIGKLTDKYGLAVIAAPALFSNLVMFFIISYSTSLWGFLVAAFISAFGYGACQPAMQALSMKSVPNERRGAASSTNYIGMDLGSLFGPTIGGSIAQAFGYAVMWRAMTGFFVLGIIVVLIFKKVIVRIEEEFEARQDT